jgi:hypothetical protein
VASLPLNKAGVGSAVNDTTRELGGALGVAVIGSILSSLYRSNIGTRIAGLPAAAHAGASSLGAALQTSRLLPQPTGRLLATAARQSYVHAFDLTLIVNVAVAVLASGFIAWLLRPMPVVVVEDEAVAAFEAA